MLIHALIGLAGLATGVAFYLAISAMVRHDRTTLLFSLLSLGLSVYTALQAAIFSTSDTATAAWLLRCQSVSAAAMFALLPWFGAAFAGNREGLFGWSISAGYAALAIWSLFSPSGYGFGSLDRMNSVLLPWGESIQRPVGRIGWSYVASQLLQYPLYIRLTLHAFHMYRKGRHVDAWLWGGSMTLLIATAFRDQGIDVGWWSGGDIGEWVFLAMLCTVGIRLGLQTGSAYKERLRMAQALRESEERFTAFMAHLPAAAFLKDATGRVLFANHYLERLLNTTDWQGKSTRDLIPGPKGQQMEADDRRVFDQGPLRIEESLPDAQGALRTFQTVKFPVLLEGQQQLLGGIAVDITERKRAEAEREQALALLEASLGQSPAGILIADAPDVRIRWANPAALEIHGDSRLALTDIDIAQHTANWLIFRVDGSPFPPEDLPLSRAVLKGELTRNAEAIIRNAQGVDRWVSVNAAPIRSRDGTIIAGIVIFTDISESKRAEAERARLSAAIEQASETIVITDTTGSIVYVNPSFERTTGYSRSEAIGKNPRILKSGRHDAAFYRELWDTLTRGDVWKGHLINRRKDGTEYEEEASISPVRDATGAVANYVAIKLDVTHERRLEEQIRQVQKLESIGRLAGGVAHDFNNLLQAIVGHADLVALDTPSDDPRRASLSEIQSTSRRAAELTNQLLAFARKQPIAPRVLDLNEVIESTLKMLRRLIGENITLTWTPHQGVWPVRIDPTQVDQILANLAVNARDAISGVGKVDIALRNSRVHEAFCACRAEAMPGEYVALSVSDTGGGIDEHVLPRLFEPFFTTKAPGHGTGLGLATVYGIVRQNQGFIDVRSTPGHGSTFTIYLPRHAASPEEGPPPVLPPRPPLPLGQGETILFVEDETSVRILARSLLAPLGYVVLDSGSPLEALRIAQNHAGPIALLITDVILPEMNGLELARQLRLSRPQTKVLLISGYTADVLGQHGVRAENLELLQKPFSLDTLAARIHRLLTGI